VRHRPVLRVRELRLLHAHHAAGRLFHVFDKPDQCNLVGDWVDDTPAASRYTAREMACTQFKDTCTTLPGTDPFDNYMDYSADLFMTKFTAGQYKRMAQALRTYRPKLVAVTAVPFGHRDSTATSLEQCTCSNSDDAHPNGAYLPTSHCRVRGELDPNAVKNVTISSPWSGIVAPPLPSTQNSTNGGGTRGGLTDGALAAIIGAAIVIIIYHCG
jgi:hypothetical protein